MRNDLLEQQRRLYARGITSSVTPGHGLIITNRSRGEIMKEAYEAGREMGAAMAAVFQVRANAEASAIMQLGMLFAAHEGFSDMRNGGAFVRGFADGIASVISVNPAQLADGNATA